jgi:hypothetical protein
VGAEEHPLTQDALIRLEASTTSADVRRIAAELLPAFYEQLRRIAKRTRVRYGAGHTMQTTALAMRDALINRAQSRMANKRGGRGPHVTLSEVADLSIESDEGMLALNEEMERLAQEMPRLADVAPPCQRHQSALRCKVFSLHRSANPRHFRPRYCWPATLRLPHAEPKGRRARAAGRSAPPPGEMPVSG